MVQRHHRSTRLVPTTRGPHVAHPRLDETVFEPELPPVPLALHTDIEARHLRASPEGYSVAALERGPGSTVVAVHSAARLPSVPFDRAMIVQTYPERGVKLWGDRDGERGIWMVTPQGVRLCARLDEVSKFVDGGPNGDIAVGPAGRDMLMHVVRESPIILPRGVELASAGGEHPHTVLPIGNRRWLHAPKPARELLDDSAGGPVWPLPFVADNVQMFLSDGKPCYLLRDGNADAIWDGYVDRVAPEGGNGGVDFIWSNADGNALAFLLRSADHADTGVRRLLANGRVEYEGTFYMRRDGFRWSSNGRHFVAHVTRTDSDGQQAEEILVTSAGLVTVGRSATIHEARVDNDGHLAYVLADKHGRRLVADGVPSPTYPYLWNISQTAGIVAANALVQGRIHRVEFSYGR